jgi:hypothetical protein
MSRWGFLYFSTSSKFSQSSVTSKVALARRSHSGWFTFAEIQTEDLKNFQGKSPEKYVP